MKGILEMKYIYEPCRIRIVAFETNDIITTSFNEEPELEWVPVESESHVL